MFGFYFSFTLPLYDSIWCDVTPMTITQFLLNWPWLYNWDMHYHGRANTYSFAFNREGIVLKLMSMKQLKEHQEEKPKNHWNSRKALVCSYQGEVWKGE